MKYLLNIDLLEMVLKTSSAEPLCDKEGFRFSNAYKPGEWNGFQKCNQITYQNQSFGWVYSSPSSRLRYVDRNAHVLRLANESLYRQTIIEDGIPAFLKAFNFTPTAIKELHIALDGPGIIDRHSTLSKNTKRFRRQRKVSETNQTHVHSDGLSTTLGSRKSDKVIAAYCKTKELEVSHKEYIRDYWRNNGLKEEDGPIDRLELRLKASEMVGLAKDISRLNDTSFLASLFKEKADSYLTFIDIKNKKRHQVIDWQQFELIEIKKEKKVQYHKPTQRIKTTLKTLFFVAIQDSQDQASELAMFIAAKHGLLDWYNHRQNRWLKDNPFFAG